MSILVGNKNKTSAWLLAAFVLLILFSSLLSELFQAPDIDISKIGLFDNPIKSHNLANIKSLKLKNRIGIFELEKNEFWSLSSPRKLKANEIVIKNLIKEIMGIKVRKLYKNDQLNLASFGLDQPQSEIKITFKDQTSYNFQFGVVNPIDNSTYLSLGDSDMLYHIENLNAKASALALSELIDSKIFSSLPLKTKQIKIFMGKNKNPYLNFSKVGNEKWSGISKRALSSEKVESFLFDLYNTKALMILDQLSVDVSASLKSYLERPQYRLEITDHQGNTFKYTVSYPLKAIAELKLEKNQAVLIKSNHRNFPFVVSKQTLKFFTTREKSFRENKVKKYIY